MPDLIPLYIRKIITETPDAKSFVLENVDGEAISYKAGQFLTFVFTKSATKADRRNYSISSSPLLNEPMQITVKRIPNGEYSRWLVDKAKEGDVLYTIGASGFFTLPADTTHIEQFFFFAAGSGITPVYAMIKTLLNRQSATKIVLIYSNTAPVSAIFYQQLKDLQNTHYDRLQIEFLFSSEKSVLHKRLGVYLLEKFLGKYITGDIHKRSFYICGPFEYMQMITIVLRNNKVPGDNIHKEIFNIERPARKPEPPDKDLHTVTVRLNNKEYTFATQYPDTILQTAKSLSIPLPYSCESGQCGTCAATCLSGKVWMWHNDVLMEEEIQNGRILTCTGYPVGGDIVIVY